MEGWTERQIKLLEENFTNKGQVWLITNTRIRKEVASYECVRLKERDKHASIMKTEWENLKRK